MSTVKIVPVAGETVIVLLTCLRAHIATSAVLCKAVGLCFKYTYYFAVEVGSRGWVTSLHLQFSAKQ